ncbi:MAG: lptD [Chthoniobacteraceae bacterium]|nr:lptD [Chthoniobacteraceae bacterium]
MKRLILCSALLLMCRAGAHAQFGNFDDIPIEIDSEEKSFDKSIATADKNVVIRYGEIVIYSDHAQYNPETRDILVSGNVRIYREGRLFTGERAIYNLETKQLSASDFRGEFFPFKFAGDSLNTLGPKGYLVKNGIFTTSDSSRPDYSIRARTVKVYPKDHIVFSNVKVFIGRTQVFWFPYLYQSLVKDQGFLITPGYSSSLGAFLLGQYGFPLGETTAKFRLDLFANRGVGTGFETRWDDKLTEAAEPTVEKSVTKGTDKGNWGRFRSYYINDAKPGTNKTALAREDIDPSRYRVSLQTRTYLTEDIYATIDINKLSDARFLQDFEPGEFRTNPNPDNAISITKWDENYTATLTARKNLNEEVFDQTERLPEGALDIKRRPLFGSRFFYDGETSAGFYRRNFAGGALVSDYDTFRADTFHQISYPNTYFGWLSVVPRAGVRGTYYANTGFYETITTTFPTTTVTTIIPGTTSTTVTNGTTVITTESRHTSTSRSSTGDVRTTVEKNNATESGTTSNTSKSSKTETRLVREGSLFRPVVNAGVEASFKLSRAFEQVQSRALGLDGLRHIVQPYANLSFVYSGEDPVNILQFDRLNRSTQLPPIDFPQFNTIDSIDNWSILRLGVRNRLQTRRDNITLNWLEMDTFFDVNIDRPQFVGDVAPDTGTFSNVFNRIRFSPLPWVNLTLDSQIPLLDQGFTEVNTALNFLVNENLSLTVGNRYLSGDPVIKSSSLLTMGGYLRLNDNWAIGARGQYEFETSLLESQRYEIHRDLSSWVASFGFVVINNRNETTGRTVSDYGLTLTFTLKDLPAVRIPLALDPDSLAGGGGSGKNR